MEAFGLVPEEEMRPGVMYGDTLSNHTELSALADAMVAAVAKGKLRKLQSDENNAMLWKKSGCCRSRNLFWARLQRNLLIKVKNILRSLSISQPV